MSQMIVGHRTLHQRLREETGPLHQELELAVDIEHEISSLPSYAGYLQRLWGLHTCAERSLAAFDFTPYGFDYSRRRSRDLERDLDAIDLQRQTTTSCSVPAPLQLGSLEAALGCVYVIEGSALGARAILPTIKQRLGLTATHGASFFVGFDEAGKAVWRACLASIAAIEADSAAANRVVDGASVTFRKFLQCLPARLEKPTGVRVRST